MLYRLGQRQENVVLLCLGTVLNWSLSSKVNEAVIENPESLVGFRSKTQVRTTLGGWGKL